MIVTWSDLHNTLHITHPRGPAMSVILCVKISGNYRVELEMRVKSKSHALHSLGVLVAVGSGMLPRWWRLWFSPYSPLIGRSMNWKEKVHNTGFITVHGERKVERGITLMWTTTKTDTLPLAFLYLSNYLEETPMMSCDKINDFLLRLKSALRTRICPYLTELISSWQLTHVCWWRGS